MKITLPNHDESAMGGGWSWLYNFKKVMGDTITSDYANADVFLIPSASMVDRETVYKAKEDGKKIILRCDNIIKNSRNRGTGMTRMKDFARVADVVVYQSRFAQDLLDRYLNTGMKQTVIMNGVDQEIFNPKGRQETDISRYIYSKYSSDPTKNWDIARLAYQNVANEDTLLNIVGRFDGIEEYNFDFYQDEKYKYWGLVSDKNAMADIYRQSDYFLYTYFQDACSQTVIEALCCGCEILNVQDMANTGGTPEIINFWDNFGAEYFGLERMKRQYLEVIGVV